MDLRLGRIALSAIALSLLIAPAFASANPCLQEQASPAEQELGNCLELAKKGDVKAAFEKAKQVRQVHGQERMFDVSYVNTLISIASDEDDVDVNIVNEAISAVNAARVTKIYDGQGDPEIAFHFMNSLGQLSETVERVSEPIAANLRVYEGRIASRLRQNTGYPKNALEALANPMIDMAKGYAEQQQPEMVFKSIESAINCGYGDYRALAEEEWFKSLIDAETTTSWLSSFDVSYRNAVDAWSQQVVREFQGASFEFKLQDIDGSTISKRDYAGKVLVVDLWATWCPPCRKGIPDFIKLQREHKRDGVAVVGISMDAPETPDETVDAVRTFVEANSVNYDIALGDTTIASQLTGKMALPTTLFFDRDGRVRYVARGYHDHAKIEAITKILVNESQTISSPDQRSFQDY